MISNDHLIPATQSPPVSQDDNEDATMTDAQNQAAPDGKDENGLATSTTHNSADNATITSTSSSANNTEQTSHSDAGSTWNNKKFREEYDRAQNTLFDQKWSMAHYGDPLLRK
ncbi:MAG: hypothetical protein M1818_007795 [Claussenomyces sp. TS43310]|nr:MAG: hypothetical protein M1818_007795 [Claussenomyces sp. TS43310]